MQNKHQLPTGLEKHLIRYPFYVRIGFGLLVMFGMVSNCAGESEVAVAVFVLTAIVWVCCRIIQEEMDSWRILRSLNELEAELKKQPPADDQ